MPLILFAVLRLYLGAGNEIHPLLYDSTNYAFTAAHYFDGGRQDSLPKHYPGVSVVAAGTARLGIPYKLGLDALLLCGAAALAHLARQSVGSRLAGLGVFFLIAFHPWFLEQSSFFMSEPLSACLLLGVVMAGLPFLTRPVSQWTAGPAIGAGIAMSAWILTRSEAPVMAIFWLSLCSLVVLRHRETLKKPMPLLWQRSGRAAALLLLPMAMAFGAREGVILAHKWHYGVAALSIYEAPGVKALLKALYTIPPDELHRYAPVTRATLQRAVEHSPTLARHQTALLNVNGHCYAAAASFGLKDEFCSWLLWLVLDGLQYSDGESAKAAAEIVAAQNSGALPRRMAVYPVDPAVREWLPDLPGVFWGTIRESFRYAWGLNAKAETVSEKNSHATPLIFRSKFEDALLLRAGLNDAGVVHATGFGVAPTLVQSVVVKRGGKIVAAAPVVGGSSPRFDLTIPDGGNEELSLEFLGEVGSLGSASLPVPEAQIQIVEIRTSAQQEGAQGEGWNVWILRKAEGEWQRKRALGLLNKAYPFLLTLGVVGLAGIAFFQRRRGRQILLGGMLQFAGLVALLVGLRSSYYTLVEVWFRWGLDRYPGPNSLILTAGILAMALFVGGWLGSRRPVVR